MMCIHGDGTDLEFWQRVDLGTIEATCYMPNHLGDVDTVRALRASGYSGFIGVSIAHDDESQDLLDAGATTLMVFVALHQACDIVIGQRGDSHLTESAVHRAIDRQLPMKSE